MTRQGVAGGGGGGAEPEATILNLDEEFTTDDDAPMTSPRTSEPGPGTIVAQNPANMYTSHGSLYANANSASNWTNTYWYFATALTRASNHAVYMKLKKNSVTGEMCVILSTSSATPDDPWDALVKASIWLDVADGINVSCQTWFYTDIRTVEDAIESEFALILQGAGYIALANINSEGWKFLWYESHHTDASLYPVLQFKDGDGAGTFDAWKTIDVIDTHPSYGSDFGQALHLSKFLGTSAIGSYSPETGNAWSVEDGSWSVSSDELLSGDAGTNILVTDVGQTDFTIYVNLNDLTTGNGIVFRYESTASHWRAVRSGGNILIQEVVLGVPTTRGTLAISMSAGNILAVRCVDTDIRVWGYRGAPVKYTVIESPVTPEGTKVGLIAEGANQGFDHFNVWPDDMSFPTVTEGGY